MLRIEIHIKGHLNPGWSEWFSGLTIDPSTPGETTLRGTLPDQAALYGLISRLRDLGLKLLSISSEEVEDIA
jgi:hypothetical protein